MKIAHIARRFWKLNRPGGWFMGLLSMALLSWLLLTSFSGGLLHTIIFMASIVNQLSCLGLLVGLLGGLSYLGMRSFKRSVLPARLVSENVAINHRGNALSETWNPWRLLLDNLATRRLHRNQARPFEEGGFGRHLKNRPRWFLLTTALLQHGQENMRELIGKNNLLPERPPRDERLRQLGKAIETLQLGVTLTDLNGKILYTNPAEATMHGYAVGELLGQDLGIFAPVELRKPMPLEQIHALRSLRESVNLRKDGSIFPVRLMSDVVKDAAGQPIAIVTTCEDLTARKRTETILKQRTRELALLNRLSELLQACTTEADTYRVVGKICKKLFPFDSGCLSLFESPQAKPKVVELWGKLHQQANKPEGKHGSGEQTANMPVFQTVESDALCPRLNFYPDNDCLCVPISAAGEILGILSLCFQGEQPVNAAYAGNNHQSKAKQAALTRVAEHYALALVNLRLRETLRRESIRDALTGLYNRRYMEESLEREARRAKRHNTPIGIIMLDIDHFKQVNDLYGHEAGDVVLKKLGKFLQRHTRGEDIACRYGGEEFLLILPEASLEVVTQRAKDLHAGVKKLRITYQGHLLRITISVGVAVLPEHSSQVKEVVKAADTAMYQAKARGRDQVLAA